MSATNKPTEVALEGWEEIAAMFKVSPKTMMRRRKELLQSGAVFYMLKGTQPARKVVCAFPSILKIWVSKKAARGEVI